VGAVRALGDLGFVTSVGCDQPKLAMHLPTSNRSGFPPSGFAGPSSNQREAEFTRLTSMPPMRRRARADQPQWRVPIRVR
jgi:hypothetical protein